MVELSDILSKRWLKMIAVLLTKDDKVHIAIIADNRSSAAIWGGGGLELLSLALAYAKIWSLLNVGYHKPPTN